MAVTFAAVVVIHSRFLQCQGSGQVGNGQLILTHLGIDQAPFGIDPAVVGMAFHRFLEQGQGLVIETGFFGDGPGQEVIAAVHEFVHDADMAAPIGQFLIAFLFIDQAFEEIIMREGRRQLFTLLEVGQGFVVGFYGRIGPGPVEIHQSLQVIPVLAQGQGLGIIVDGQLVFFTLFIDSAAVEIMEGCARFQGNGLVTIGQGLVIASQKGVNGATAVVGIGIAGMGFDLAVDDLQGLVIILGPDGLQQVAFPIGLQGDGSSARAFRYLLIVSQGQAGNGQKA